MRAEPVVSSQYSGSLSEMNRAIVQLVSALSAVTLCCAAPQGNPSEAAILNQYNDFSGLGSWKWGFRTDNGIHRYESGYIRDEGTQNEALEVSGNYSWTAPNGVTYTVTYVGSKDGFKATEKKTPEAQVPLGSIEKPSSGYSGICGAALTSLACG